MSRTPSLETLRLWSVPTIASYSASNTAACHPTVAEITAGVDATPFLTRTGLDTPMSGKTIPVAGIDNAYDSTVPGPWGGQPVVVEFYRDDTTDTAWNTFVRGLKGYWVVARFGFTGASHAPLTGDKCEVWPKWLTSAAMAKTSDTAPQMFTVDCAVPSPPALYSTVA